jgi:FkbM family methyltransferase
VRRDSAKRVVRRLSRAFGLEVVRLSKGELLRGHLPRLLSQCGINLVLDVGAHQGEYARFIRSAGYAGRIVSFEPVAATFSALERAASTDSMWQTHQLALGARDQEATINVAAATTLASLRRPSGYSLQEFPGKSNISRVETVEVRRLDGIFESVAAGLDQPRAYLKLDTQGWDLEVLAGAAGCLPQILALQSELSVQPLYEGTPGYLAALTELHALGYELTGLFPVVRDGSERVIELDCVMRRGLRSG